MLRDVLYVPKLSYNLLRVAKRGKIVKFTRSACYILNKEHKMVAKATKIGSLYQLDHKPNHERATFADKSDTKEDIWHKLFAVDKDSAHNLCGKFASMSIDLAVSTRVLFIRSATQFCSGVLGTVKFVALLLLLSGVLQTPWR